MDEQRRIRHLYPPVYLAAALLWAWHRSQIETARFYRHGWRETLRPLQEAIGPDGWPQALTLLVAGGALVLSAGFVIGTLSFLLLRGASWCVRLGARKKSKKSWRLEAVMSEKGQRRVLRHHFGLRGTLRERGPFLVAAFDHQRIGPGLRAWIDRRWNAFHLNAHSATALLLAMALVPFFGFGPDGVWWGTMVVGVGLFAWAAWSAYDDTWKMNDLLAEGLPDWAQDEELREPLDDGDPDEDPLPRAKAG